MEMSIIRFGVFGKVGTYGDFVSIGTSSTTGRSFERWCQMANDQVASANRKLPEGPFGFYYRDAAAESLLIGVMVGSQDNVGRPSPLSVFFELEIGKKTRYAGLAGAYRALLTRLSALAVGAPSMTQDSLRAAIGAIKKPDATLLRHEYTAEIARLDTLRLKWLLDRIFSSWPGPAHALEVLARACDLAKSTGPTRPTTVEVRASSDAELLFWLACLEQRLAGAVGPLATFWHVDAQRVFLIPGVPDVNTLSFLCQEKTEHSRLWPTQTSDEGEKAAVERISAGTAAVLGNSTATAEDLINAWAG